MEKMYALAFLCILIKYSSSLVLHSDVDVARELQELRQEVVTLKAEMAKIKQGPGIAFTAYLDVPMTTLQVGQTVPFDRVLTDVGRNYNRADGRFLTPVTGTYFFAWHTEVHGGHTLTTCLAINGTCQIHAYANAASDDHGDIQNDGNNAILNLNAGDFVSIAVQAGNYIYSNSGAKWFYPTFVGYKLF